MDSDVGQQEKGYTEQGGTNEGFPPRRPIPRALESFRFPDYRWLWLGTFFSFMAVGMQQITRGWLILRLTEDSPLPSHWS